MAFDTERTPAGDQYLIPGTERQRRARGAKYPREGSQLVIPGAEQVGTRELLERRLALPLVPRRGQRTISTTPLLRAPK